MLGRLVDEIIAEKGVSYPWGDLLPVLRGADAVFVNLECALTAHTERWHDGDFKTFSFRADPTAVQALIEANVRLVALGNNHVLDFGPDGLHETIEVLDRAGIAHAGAGANAATAATPAVVTIGDLRVAVVAFADYPAAWAAAEAAPGINYTPISTDAEDFAVIEGALAKAADLAEMVIFSIHWGPNMRERPAPAFRQFAHRVIAGGADLFWGHSAHVVQGVERYRGHWILYDCGDLVDDYIVDPELRNDLTALFLLAPARENTRIEVVPVQIREMSANLARGYERDWLLRRLGTLCGEMGTTVEERDGRVWVAATERT